MGQVIAARIGFWYAPVLKQLSVDAHKVLRYNLAKLLAQS